MATIKETIDLIPDNELKGWLLHLFRYFLNEDPEDMYSKLGLNIQTFYLWQDPTGMEYFTGTPPPPGTLYRMVYRDSEGGHSYSNRATTCLYGLVTYYRRQHHWIGKIVLDTNNKISYIKP